MAIDRLMLKHRAIIVRGGVYHCRCDRCGRLLRTLGEAGELHEIFVRARTPRNSAARDASYATELISLLCHRCHRHYHDHDSSDAEKGIFIQHNYRLYGVERVRRAYARLQSLLKCPLPYHLPEAQTDAD